MAGITGIGNRRRDAKPRKKRVKNQDRWLLNKIDEASSGNAFTTSRGGVFFPSSIGSTCDRAVYNDYNAIEKYEPISPQLQRVFDYGHDFEDRLHKTFKKSLVGDLVGVEVKTRIDNPFPCSGRIDFLVRDPKRGIVVIELKTINDKGFEALSDVPKWEHFVQIQCYLHMYNLEHGSVVYLNKNDSDMKAFKTQRDFIFWDELTERLQAIAAMKEPPDKCTGAFYCKCGGKK